MADESVRGGTDAVPILGDLVGASFAQRIKLDLGGDGVSAPVVGALPVSQPGLSGGILQSVTTVGTTAVPVPATPLTGRAALIIRAAITNTADIYIGTSSVTADTAATGGLRLAPGESVPIALAAAVVLYARSTAASQKVVTLEIAA